MNQEFRCVLTKAHIESSSDLIMISPNKIASRFIQASITMSNPGESKSKSDLNNPKIRNLQRKKEQIEKKIKQVKKDTNLEKAKEELGEAEKKLKNILAQELSDIQRARLDEIESILDRSGIDESDYTVDVTSRPATIAILKTVELDERALNAIGSLDGFQYMQPDNTGNIIITLR